jgi:hypothetical protein
MISRFAGCYILLLIIPLLGFGQSISHECGSNWAEKLWDEFARVQKDENMKETFKNRPAKILPLAFYRIANEDFASSGYDTTLLGQNLSRSFAAALNRTFTKSNEPNQWEVMPPLENSIFQKKFVFVQPDNYAQESEENKRRLLELQPDFLLCGEYELLSDGLNLLQVKLQRVAHPGNPFPKQDITLWSGKLEVPFANSFQFSECKAKDIKPFDARIFKELMDEFSGFPLEPLALQKMSLNDDKTFSLDSLIGDLKTGAFYKMQVYLSKPLYVYAFSFERLDTEKRYLYFIQNFGSNQSQFKKGKTISNRF